MTRARHFTSGGKSRRSTVWLAQKPLIDVAAAADSATFISALDTFGKSLLPFTIVRTHVALRVRSDQLSASESYQMGFGGSVVSDQATTIGITAIPNPISDQNSDLFFIHRLEFGELLLASAVGFEENGAKTIQIDSKAMRKVGPEEDVVFCMETGSVSGGIIVTTGIRMLVKLH